MPGTPGKSPEPLFHTPDDQLNKVERYKQDSALVDDLPRQYRDLSHDDLADCAEQISKSHGIYLEYNRARTGREKDWMFMVRVSIPGGGAFTAAQWRVFDEIANKYADHNPAGGPSLRLTTRQNVQYHWVKKPQIIPLVQEIAATGFYTLNGCGDNVRNVMGCPLSKYSDFYNANDLARQYAAYFRLPAAPHIQVFAIDPNAIRDEAQQYDYGPKLLNRKFKLAFSAVHRNPSNGEIQYDNCVELRTNEVGIAPIYDPKADRVDAFMLYVGGGQGEKNGKPTFAGHGLPFGVFKRKDLMLGLKSIVDVHKEWGDRKNRHWARLKYVINAQGIDWYRQQVRQRGAEFSMPLPDFDPGARMLHHGWMTLPNKKLAYGAYVECGRLTDKAGLGDVQGSGPLKSMVRRTMDHFEAMGIELLITPNQDLIFANIEPEAKDEFDARLKEFGHGSRKGKPYSRLRVLSGACVGLPTCRLSYTESEQFEPELIDQLEELGYGDVNESIGITGCERQCFRPATKTLGWIGQGPDMYGLKIGGSEDARYQGQWLVEDEQWYLRQVPRDQVAAVCAFLFDDHAAHKLEDEDLGAYLRRIGMSALIAKLKENQATAPLMQKTATAPFQPQLEHIFAQS
ncbi:MAG: nitrite/sulfite reductase [Phycisphaeraceae bacterium]|nr:nitrite/sulfite reductase [Phycisphaeraceae bacterium]